MSFVEASEVLGNLGEFIASIVVLGTLVYLLIQIRQAREQIRLFGQRHRADAARDVLTSISDSPELARIFATLGEWSFPDFGLDSDEDTIRWTCWCHAWMRTEEMNFRMNSPTERETQRQLLMAWLSTSWGRKFWIANRAIYDADFAALADRLHETILEEDRASAELLASRGPGGNYR